MGEKMTLEQVRGRLREAALYGLAGSVCQALASHLDAHLTQPAQAVDVDAIAPRSWLDPMLTGPSAVIGKPPYGCQDIERVLSEVRKRLTAALPNANGKEGS